MSFGTADGSLPDDAKLRLFWKIETCFLFKCLKQGPISIKKRQNNLKSIILSKFVNENIMKCFRF